MYRDAYTLPLPPHTHKKLKIDSERSSSGVLQNRHAKHQGRILWILSAFNSLIIIVYMVVPLTEEIWPLEKGGELCKIIKANCMIIRVTTGSISKGKDDGFRVS